MACELCDKMTVDWTSHDEEFYATFDVIDDVNTTMMSNGMAECKACGKKSTLNLMTL